MVATRRAKAEATARAFTTLDVEMLSGIASFGGRRELWGLAAILKSPTGRELTDIQERGLHTWMCFERLARSGDDANFNSGIDDDVGAAAQEEQDLKCFGGAACRTFPFEVQVGRPHFFDGSGEGGSRRPLRESPRKLLPDARALIEARLNASATSSICATVKALHGWQAALDATRRTRAVAEARAEHARHRAPQGGSSRRRGAKRSAPPEVPVEELTIRESDCLPYEYEGPPMATMGGGGGCVVA